MDDAQVARIIEGWTSGQDVWQGDGSWMGEKYDDALVYPPASLTKKPGSDYRVLPEHHAEEARKYIAVICKRYPLQVRVLFGLAMWLRFCEVWHMTGDARKSMRVI